MSGESMVLSKTWKRIVKTAVLMPLFFVASAYLLNAVILSMSAPNNVSVGEKEVSTNNISTLKIVFYDDLVSGGIPVFGLNAEAAGYVNMLSPDETIYISSDNMESFDQNNYLYKHEFTHILQKEMIAEKTGGYPSVSNPWLSFKYYYNLHKLNSELREVMPKTVEDSDYLWFMTDGFEAAAECYAQPASELGKPPVYYDAQYLENGYCSAEQKRLAITLITTDEWFSPVLTEKEKSQLKPVNITTTNSGKSTAPVQIPYIEPNNGENRR